MLQNSNTEIGTQELRTTITLKLAKNIDEQKDKCRFCCSVQIRELYFSQCQHIGEACINCLQKYMKQKINNKIYPTCYFQGCNAKMAIFSLDEKKNNKLFFNYFSQNGKQQWRKFQQQYQLNKFISSLKPCTIPDCIGFIKCNRCTKCSQFYCQACGQIDHQYKQSCSKIMRQSIDPDAKVCPNCKESYVRQIGCNQIKCKCKHQFCYVCGKDWNRSHHLCKQQKQQIQNNKKKQKIICCVIF